MSKTHGLVARIEEVLPVSLGQRIRWLFAAFAVLVGGLAALGLIAVEKPLWPNRAVAAVVLATLSSWAWAQYRRRGLSAWWDPVPVAGVFLAGWATGHPGNVFGLMFVLLFARALYGSAARVWANTAAYFVAYEAAKLVTVGPSQVFDISLVTMALGVMFSTGVMWLLGDVIRAQERETRREAVLAAAASRLQRADTHAEMYTTAVDAALELVEDVPGAAVSMWRGDPTAVRIGGLGGGVPDDLPVEVPLAVLPDDVHRALLAGDPFVLGEDAARLVQQAVQVEWDFVSVLVVPLTHGRTFAGALVLASHQELPDELTGSFGRLGADVALALDRADSTVLLRQVVDSSSDAILLLDGEMTVDFASAAIEPALGYRPADLVGRALVDLFADGTLDVPALLEGAASASARNDPHVRPMCHSDGSVRLIELAASRLPATRRRGWVVNLRDVTRRVDAERALRDSERRFRSLAESVTEGLYQMTLHPEPRFEYVNPAMEQMTGYPAARFLAEPDLTIREVHPDDRHAVERTRTAPDTVAWPVEVRWRHPDQGWRWVSLRETIAYDAHGRPVSSMGIVSDITGRKAQEEALRNALGKERQVTEGLRQVDKMKTTFIQAVSHELRTPLTAIVGYAQTVNRGSGRLDEATRSHLLQRLEANASKLDRLLSDLLDVDRLSSDTVEPIRRRLDLADLCRRTIDQIEGSSHRVTCTPDTVEGNVDAAKVERIVENLVRNAMKHTDPGTPIIVDVFPADDGAIITVEDRGPGIPQHLHETIFEPFVQGADSASSAKPGTGIGLALVARFAELHGGRAWIEQPEPGGTRFCVRLPDAPPARAGSAVRVGVGLTGRQHRRGPSLTSRSTQRPSPRTQRTD